MSADQTLTEFLLARIAEDEGRARVDQADAMMGYRWKHAPQEVYDELQAVVLNWTRRTLAECEAKRRIVGAYVAAGQFRDDLDRVSLRALAAIYAEHEDYRPEWGA